MSPSVPPYTFDAIERIVEASLISRDEGVRAVQRVVASNDPELLGAVVGMLSAAFVARLMEEPDPMAAWKRRRAVWAHKLYGDPLPKLEFRDRGRIWKGYEP